VAAPKHSAITKPAAAISQPENRILQNIAIAQSLKG
jgi:hypothetical protein